MGNLKYDKVIKNKPINDDIMRRSWIYDGQDDTKFSPFTGKALNASAKNMYTNMIYTDKVLQIVKSCMGIFEGNYSKYTTVRKCCDNPNCPHTNMQDYDKIKYTKLCPYMIGDTVKFDDIFYVSLKDENNSQLSDNNSWYLFNYSIDKRDPLILEDIYYKNKYQVVVKQGTLNLVKIEGDNEKRVETYTNSTAKKTAIPEKDQAILTLSEITNQYKIKMETLERKYSKIMADITLEYTTLFKEITGESIE